MSPEQRSLEAAIAALEAQREVLGDAVVKASLDALRFRLAALTAEARKREPALRQVSILFLDIVGSTALSQHLDPEAIHVVIDGALERCTRLVEAHGGKVLQYAGDNLLGAFGAEVAREDDAGRAVRCGLALLELGRELGEDVLRAHGHGGVDVRVGVHTGSVLLGGGVDAEGSIRGIAVNIAARMEQTAPAGRLRISRDTYLLVRGHFETEPREPLHVKGLDEPLWTYLVTRERPRPSRPETRGIEGAITRMMGREDEMGRLQRAFERFMSDRALLLVSLVGEAGIGKSRLLDEFARFAQGCAARLGHFRLINGSAYPLTLSQPYGLLHDLLLHQLRVGDGEAPEAAAGKLERALVALFAPDDGADLAQAHAHLLGHLIGMDFSSSRHIRGIRDDPRQIRSRAFHAGALTFRRLWERHGERTMLLLDDLHWADDASLEFLEFMAEVNRDVPTLIVSSTRATLFERFQPWRGAEDVHQRIELAPLSPRLSRRLVDELLDGVTQIPEAVRERVVRRAEGNPFYLEELVRMLVDRVALDAGSTPAAPDHLRAQQVPASLVSVLQARLDALPAAEKLALQEASVAGQVFWDQALAALDRRAVELLPSLARRDLALPRVTTRLEGLREYTFRHQILHQVTYDTVLRRQRRDWHRKVAHWLAGLADAGVTELFGLTAWHFEMAGDAQHAGGFHARAAEHARERFAHAAALDHARRALALLDAEARPRHAAARLLRWRLLDVRERTLDLLGLRAEQLKDIDALQQLADELADDRRRAEVAWRRSDLAFRTADHATQLRCARQAVALAAGAGDDELRLRALQRLALAQAYLGEHCAAATLAAQGRAESRALGLRRHEGLFLNTLSVVAGLRNDLVAGLELDRQHLAIQQEIGNRRGEAIGHGNLGTGWLALGDIERARQHLEQGLRLARSNGDRQGQCGPLGDLSCVALWQGDHEKASALARSARDVAVAARARDWLPNALFRLGDAELASARLAQAEQAFSQALEAAQEIDSPWQHHAMAGLMRVALRRGNLDAALPWLERLLAVDLDSRYIELSCYQVLTSAGDARAAAVLDRAHDALHAVAATIADADLRQRFLTQVPEHRELEVAWLDMRRGRGP